MKMKLSDLHMQAVNRKRRTIAHFDANTIATFWGGISEQENMTLIEAYRKRAWQYIDENENMFDSIHWDACFEDEFAFCHRSYLPQVRKEVYRKMYDEGVDLYDELVSGCKNRGLECILSHRISGTDIVSGNEATPMKTAHPEYYIDDWMRMQNMAVPQMREHKLKMLTECMENYGFDGVEIDFCRHTPFLEPGKQWELREHVTEFMRMLRNMTLRIEREKNRAILLSARVPQSVKGCHIDGLDIEQWALEGLVDTLTIGSRSYEVDIESFREATCGKVKLFPCFDMHHQTDAYAEPDMEIYMGVFSNWWDQGADAITIFNHASCDYQTYIDTHGAMTGIEGWNFGHLPKDTTCQTNAICMAGKVRKMMSKDKTYVIERRGGYPWENGYANNNMDKQLPAVLSNNGKETVLTMRVSDPVAHIETSSVNLVIVVYGLETEDQLLISLNGTKVEGEYNTAWKDKQIIPLGKELVSGYCLEGLPERDDIFTRIECSINPVTVIKGLNYISFSVKRKLKYAYCSKIEIERVEFSVKY